MGLFIMFRICWASENIGTKLLKKGDILERRRGCRLAWFRLGDLGSLSAGTRCALRGKDPGSNPGSPTKRLVHEMKLDLQSI